MKLSKKLSCALLIICVFFGIALSGCHNSKDLDDLAIVLGIGIDKADGDGNYMLTAQIANVGKISNPGSGSAGSTDGESSSTYINAVRSGPGIMKTLQDISLYISRKIYTEHNQIIIIGSELAYEGISPVLDYFVRSHEGRLNEFLLIAEGEAAKLFNEQMELESMPAVHIRKLMEAQGWNSVTSATTILDFMFEMASKTTAPTAPIVEMFEDSRGKQKVRIAGTAVFRGDKICGSLSSDQTKAMMLIRNKLTTSVLNVEADGVNVSLDLRKVKSVIKPEYQDGRFKINGEIKLDCTISEAPARHGQNPDDLLNDIKNAAQSEIKRLLDDTLMRTKSLKSDVFGFGELIYRRFPSESKEQLANWAEFFPQLEVDLSVELDVSSKRTILMPIFPHLENEAGEPEYE